LSEVDRSGEGIIRFEDFLDIMTQKMLERAPVEEKKKVFHLICEEGQDKITLKSLQKIAKELGENISVEELQEMIEEADRDRDREIGEDDFLKVMKITNLF
jgi:centrin-1